MNISEQLQRVFTKAKVQVVTQRTVQDRNERGHFVPGTRRTQLVLTGEGVENPFVRTYFRNKRVPKLVEAGVKARLLKVRKNSGEVILEIAA